MLKIMIFAGVAVLLLITFIVGRKIKPEELEEEVEPGVKPFIPSEETAIFGTRRLKPEDYLIPGLPEAPLAPEESHPVTQAALIRSTQLLQDGDGEGAAQALKRALGERTEDPELLQALGDVYRTLGQYRKALGCYRQAQRALPGDINLLLAQAATLEAMDQKPEALLTYRGVLKVNPEMAEAADGIQRLLKEKQRLQQWP